jgi:hypothetical protein
MRVGPHPQALSLAHSRSLGPQALLIPDPGSITDSPARAFCLLT